MKKEVVVGIDLGGTSTKVGFVTAEGEVLAIQRFDTHGHEDFSAFIERLGQVFDQLLKTCPGIAIKGIGIGSPNANYFTGQMMNPPNFSWGKRVPLAKSVGERLGLPAVITNDANAAALSENLYGLGIGLSDFVVLTLGTGLGSGIVVNNKLLLGQDGIAGEMGHVNVRPDGRKCNCGLSGCLETYVSVTGIKRTVFKLVADLPMPSKMRSYSYDDLTGLMITEAALEGDPIAKEAFAYTGEILGTKLADTVAYLSPQAIILTGGLTKAGDLLLDPTRAAMEDRLFHMYRGKVKLMISEVGGEHDAVLGAAALAWQEFAKE
ncbi:MAG: ROK family protein [Saprospiraceae bacterium]